MATARNTPTAVNLNLFSGLSAAEHFENASVTSQIERKLCLNPMCDDHSVATAVFFHWMHTAVGNWKLKGFLYLGGKNRASVIGMQQHPSHSA